MALILRSASSPLGDRQIQCVVPGQFTGVPILRFCKFIGTEGDEKGNALTKHQNSKTFVRPRDHELEWGDTVCIKIVDVGPNHAEALALEKIE
jgi:hypothetical protein